MTAYTKLQIIHIGTDVHIRVRGTCGKHLSELLSACILVIDSTGGLYVTHTVIIITIQTLFKWESLLNIGNAYFIRIHIYNGIQCSKS